MQTPVSYTHLDVYKRQRVARCQIGITQITDHSLLGLKIVFTTLKKII